MLSSKAVGIDLGTYRRSTRKWHPDIYMPSLTFSFSSCVGFWHNTIVHLILRQRVLDWRCCEESSRNEPHKYVRR
jgi:hypothetical protein